MITALFGLLLVTFGVVFLLTRPRVRRVNYRIQAPLVTRSGKPPTEDDLKTIGNIAALVIVIGAVLMAVGLVNWFMR